MLYFFLACASLFSGFFLFLKTAWGFLPGGGLLLAAFPLFVHSYRTCLPFAVRLRFESALSRIWRSRLLREFFPVVILAAFSYFMMPDTFWGDRMVSHDHPVHFAQIAHLNKVLVEQRTIWGWSHDWFAGYPVSYFYPVGGYLLVLLVHYLFSGLLSLDAAYALTFGLVFFFSGYAIYFFTKEFFNRRTGLMAAIIFLADPGWTMSGGWAWMVLFGVWPANLAMAFALLAMKEFERVIQGPGWRATGCFGLWMGFALLSHIFALSHFLIFIPLGLLVYGLMSPDKLSAKGILKLLVAVTAGVFIGALWVLPLFSVRAESYSPGNSWLSLPEIGERLIRGDLFEGTWPLVTMLGFAGLLGLLFSRRPGRFLVGILPFAYLFLGAGGINVVAWPEPWRGYVQSIEYQRFPMIIKIFWFIAAAYLIDVVAMTIVRWARGDLMAGKWSRDRGLPAVVARFFLIGVILLPVLYSFGKTVVRHPWYHQAEYFSKRVNQKNRREVAQWLNRRQEMAGGFWRVGLARSLGDANNHDYLDFSTLVTMPFFKMEHTPAGFYKYKVVSDQPDILRDVNVRYVLTDQPLASPEYSLRYQSGNLKVYEWRDWNPRPWTVIGGPADVRLSQFADQRVVLHVDARGQGSLVLHVAPFSRWQAFIDGERVPILSAVLNDGKGPTFMSVSLRPGAGTYEFVFRTGWAERFSFGMFLLGLSLAGSAIFWGSRGEPSSFTTSAPDAEEC